MGRGFRPVAPAAGMAAVALLSTWAGAQPAGGPPGPERPSPSTSAPAPAGGSPQPEQPEQPPPAAPSMPAPPPDANDANMPFYRWPRATDDWFGARSKLEDAGVTVNSRLVADYSEVFQGG